MDPRGCFRLGNPPQVIQANAATRLGAATFTAPLDLEVEWCSECRSPKPGRSVGLDHLGWIAETETAARVHDRDDCNAFTASPSNSPNPKPPVRGPVEQARALGR